MQTTTTHEIYTTPAATGLKAGPHMEPFIVISVCTSATHVMATDQGLTLVHFSAQLDPCPKHKNTSHTINTP